MSDGSSSWVFKFINIKRFHFFKIILPATIQQKRLGLPRKFIKKFGKELSEVAVLTVPNGKKWHVELKEIEGQICLENGWQKFVDYYSISVGHFLVFGYDGSSYFHVLIFDTSATEMEYPCHIMDFEEPNLGNECQVPSKQSESVEMLDISPPGPIGAESVKGISNESNRHQTSTMGHLESKGKCETSSMQGSDSVEIVDVPPKRQKRTDLMKEVIDESEPQQTSKVRHQTPRSRLRSFEKKVSRPTFDSHLRWTTPKRDRNSTKNVEACFTGTQSTESDGCDLALQEESSDHVPISRSSKSTIFSGASPVTTLMTRVARDFKSDNPFYLVIMQSANVNEPFTLNVPNYFARKYFKQNLCSTLRVSDGRSWRVHGRSWRVRCHSLESIARISRGWRYFVKENLLKEGDVCVFELVNRNNMEEMKVVIYRADSLVV